METGQPSDLRRAQEIYAAYARTVGFEPILFEAPPLSVLEDANCPLAVQETAQRFGGDFLGCQPNLVLRLGGPQPPKRTLMLNFHMDTVDGFVPIDYRDDTFFGRGAADAKGPGVALLAGVRKALADQPEISDDVLLLIQSVGGEEGAPWASMAPSC